MAYEAFQFVVQLLFPHLTLLTPKAGVSGKVGIFFTSNRTSGYFVRQRFNFTSEFSIAILRA